MPKKKAQSKGEVMPTDESAPGTQSVEQPEAINRVPVDEVTKNRKPFITKKEAALGLATVVAPVIIYFGAVTPAMNAYVSHKAKDLRTAENQLQEGSDAIRNNDKLLDEHRILDELSQDGVRYREMAVENAEDDHEGAQFGRVLIDVLGGAGAAAAVGFGGYTLLSRRKKRLEA